MKYMLLGLALVLSSQMAAAAAPLDEIQIANSFGLKNLQYAFDANATTNVIYSPISAQLLLSMLLNGASGKTADEISSTLQIPRDQLIEANQKVLSLITDLNSRPNDELKLIVANGLWVSPSITVKQSYIGEMQKSYQAEVDALTSADQLNGWAAQKTNGLINKIIDDVQGLDMIMANATYFKGAWTKPFGAARPADFTLDGGQTLKANMMSTMVATKYLDAGSYQAVELPYGPNRTASMIVILPKQGSDLTVFRRALDINWYQTMTQQLAQSSSTLVAVTMPKTTGKTSFKMNDSLKAMGMPTMFTTDADLSNISDRGLSVSYIKQDAAIKIDENGTEAAAVTSTGLHTAAIQVPKFRFIADRPFYYFIRDNNTGTLLFAGQIVTP